MAIGHKQTLVFFKANIFWQICIGVSNFEAYHSDV